MLCETSDLLHSHWDKLFKLSSAPVNPKIEANMTLIELVTTIGNVLTQIDVTLQTPGMPDPDWQTLYALRKHLDDQQRDLVRKSINEADNRYKALTTKLDAASNELKNSIGDLTKVGNVITELSNIASYLDQTMKLVGPMV